ncbi:DUF427 domain-containing protein [Kitasatospora griseola]|uniref:DUF427 domain-containing protein n=1 Tax=Kitasatospora griseola TaxID=2064 RepID=UPI003855DB75
MVGVGGCAGWPAGGCAGGWVVPVVCGGVGGSWCGEGGARSGACGVENRDAAWFCPEPKPEAEQVRDRVAFWRGVDVVASE